MACVLVEQSFDPPIAESAHAALLRKLDICLEMRDGIRVRSYAAPARDRFLYELEAPDAEKARNAMRSAAFPFVQAFTVDLIEAEPPAAPGAVHAVVEMRDEASHPRVTWIRSYRGKDRCIFEIAGPDAATLLAVAGDRVWIAAVLRIEDDPAWLAKRDRLRARIRR